MNLALQARINRVQLLALVIGLTALCITALGAIGNLRQFFFSYLFALLFWAGLSSGCFLVTMIHQLTGGRWGYPTRRFLEAGFLVLPLILVLFIPIFFGLQQLYPWARPAEVTIDKVLQQRHFYQNGWTYITRTVFFIGI